VLVSALVLMGVCFVGIKVVLAHRLEFSPLSWFMNFARPIQPPKQKREH
jgi:hypothetical protein